MKKQNKQNWQFSKTANVVQRHYQMFVCLTNSSQLFTVVLIWRHFATNLFQHLTETHQGVDLKTRSGCPGFEKIPCIDHTLTAIDIDKVKVISGLKVVPSREEVYFIPLYQSKEKMPMSWKENIRHDMEEWNRTTRVTHFLLKKRELDRFQVNGFI